MMSVPVMSLGIRSGVNWMRLNTRPKRLRQGAHQQRLGGAGKAGDQAVAAHEQADHHLFQHLLLADDHAAHLRHDLGLHLAEALDARLQYLGFNCCVTVVDMIVPFLFLDGVAGFRSFRRSIPAEASAPGR